MYLADKGYTFFNNQIINELENIESKNTSQTLENMSSNKLSPNLVSQNVNSANGVKPLVLNSTIPSSSGPLGETDLIPTPNEAYSSLNVDSSKDTSYLVTVLDNKEISTDSGSDDGNLQNL